MRYATFLVAGTDGQSADVSVVALGGGDVLANVNRWRGQLGLPAVKEEELPTVVNTIQVDGQSAVLVDIVGHSGADGANASLTRMLAAIVPHADRTWFFKLTGPDALVTSQKKAFEDFVRSVHFHDSSGGGGG